MRPFLIILISLIFIIGVGYWTLDQVSNSSDKLLSLSDRLEDKINKGLWDDASEALSDVESTWGRTKAVWTVLLNHTEIDNIDISLAKLGQYIYAKESGLALAETASLKLLFRHIPKKERPSLENIF